MNEGGLGTEPEAAGRIVAEVPHNVRVSTQIPAMTALILGLVLFLGVHSVRIVADSDRTDFVARRGLKAWKGLYSVASLVGFVLMTVAAAHGLVTSLRALAR